MKNDGVRPEISFRYNRDIFVISDEEYAAIGESICLTYAQWVISEIIFTPYSEKNLIRRIPSHFLLERHKTLGTWLNGEYFINKREEAVTMWDFLVENISTGIMLEIAKGKIATEVPVDEDELVKGLKEMMEIYLVSVSETSTFDIFAEFKEEALQDFIRFNGQQLQEDKNLIAAYFIAFRYLELNFPEILAGGLTEEWLTGKRIIELTEKILKMDFAPILAFDFIGGLPVSSGCKKLDVAFDVALQYVVDMREEELDNEIFIWQKYFGEISADKAPNFLEGDVVEKRVANLERLIDSIERKISQGCHAVEIYGGSGKFWGSQKILSEGCERSYPDEEYYDDGRRMLASTIMNAISDGENEINVYFPVESEDSYGICIRISTPNIISFFFGHIPELR